MGLTSDDLYAVVGDKVVSVHVRMKFDTNLLSMSGADTTYELRVDGEVVDSHRHGTIAKGGSLFATLSDEGQNTSLQVDVRPKWFTTEYRLLINDSVTPLTRSSEAEIKALWHRKRLR